MITTSYSYQGKSVVDTAADFVLSPARYFFRGRTYYMVDNKPTNDLNAGPCFGYRDDLRTRPLQTIAKIVALLPGLLAGIVLKLVVYATSPAFRQVVNVMSEFRKQPPFTEVPYKAPELDPAYHDKSLAEMSSVVADACKPLSEAVNKEEIWDDPAFIERFTRAMTLAYQKGFVLFKQLENECGGNKEKMAEVLVEQRRSPCYAYPFFRNSVTQLYHAARGRWYDQEIDGTTVRPALTREQQLNFYDPSKVQNQWRMIYNSYCQLLDTYELRSRLSDDRFSKWTQKDLINKDSIVVTLHPPGIQPT